jgi:hypothetical protein
VSTPGLTTQLRSLDQPSLDLNIEHSPEDIQHNGASCDSRQRLAWERENFPDGLQQDRGGERFSDEGRCAGSSCPQATDEFLSRGYPDNEHNSGGYAESLQAISEFRTLHSGLFRA